MLRATLKGLLSRKLRLILSGLAVTLGVMFVSGSLVLTDTIGRSFDQLFTGVYDYTDIQVRKTSDAPGAGDTQAPVPISAADVSAVSAVAGVDSAVGQVFTVGARVVDKNGKVVLGTGAPRFGASWTGEADPIRLRHGRGPTSDAEIVISANLAKTTGFTIGDSVGVLTMFRPKQTFTVVGISDYVGGRDSLAGETMVFFTERVAQESMLGEAGVFNVIEVHVADHASITTVRDDIAAALGPRYAVQTGAELAQTNSDEFRRIFQYFNYVLLGFANVALFVGIFLILNTFSIIVAQRTRELALLRAVGAGRAQMIGSVLAEALIIGVIAAVGGLAAGVGIGAALGGVLGSVLSGGSLELAPLGVPTSAIVASFLVGLAIPVLAALVPALRASRIPPVAAMREASRPDRPLTRSALSGVGTLGAGVTALALGLAGRLGDANLWGILAGLLIAFVGVALLTPVVSRPVVALLGWTLSWTAAGKLGQRNAGRNPRRTAITASALMVSIALVTGTSIVVASLQESTVRAAETGLNADLVISADPLSGDLGAIDQSAVAAIGHVAGVERIAVFYTDLATVDGAEEVVSAATDFAAASAMFTVTATAGDIATLPPGGVVVDRRTAAERGLALGDTIAVAMSRGAPRTYKVTGIYEATTLFDGFHFAEGDALSGFRSPTARRAFVDVAAGADVEQVERHLAVLLRDSPEVSISAVDDYVARSTQIFDFVLVFVQLLLGLAMIIAVLGIVNTLALSMIERTRELGMLRAIGLKRTQLASMITAESVVISAFGAVLGIAVGGGLGAVVVRALRDQGLTELAFPWPLMASYGAASVAVGVVAALIPAFRAARLDVLRAVAYE